MRTFKFRAWDKDKKEMFNVTELWIQKEFLIGSDSCRTSNVWMPATKTSSDIMQFTGLLDKNGKEIYEKDIVEIRNPINQIQKAILLGTVIFSYGAFGIEINKVEKWKSYNVDPPSIYWFLNIVDSKFIEVIGNIYENPELLKGEIK